MRFTSLAMVGSAVAVAMLAGACGSSGGSSNPSDAGGTQAEAAPTATPDSGPAPASDAAAIPDVREEPEAAVGYPAFKPTDVPQVAAAGGPVVKAPKIVPIFYAADDSATVASLKDFLAKLPGSAYWASFTKEYGVGDITIGAPITLTDTLPASYDDTQIQAALTQKLQSADPAFPAPDANTIYTFFFPPNVTITTGAGTPAGDGGAGGASDAGVTDAGATDSGAPGGGTVSSSCTAFGGYHDNITGITVGTSTDVAYAVVPRCPSFGPLMGLDAITGPASHEIAEAVTDPFPSTQPEYATVDTTHGYWTRLLGGGEVGDMCAQGDTFTKFPPSVPYTVQRIWSNAAAMAGGDPCLPLVTGQVYFNTIPNSPDILTITSRGATINPKGIEIPVGGSKTLELDLFSDAPTGGPWTVKILDLGYLGGGAANTYLTPSFAECQGATTCQGQNGDKLHVTLKVLAAGRRNYEPFLIESKLPSGHYNLWAGIVGSSPDGG